MKTLPEKICIVTSCAKRASHRDAIRNTWGAEFAARGIPVFFVEGNHPSFAIEGDMILVPEEDDYKSIINKMMRVYAELSEIPGWEIMLKMDDDIVINTERFFRRLTDNYQGEAYGGYILPDGPPSGALVLYRRNAVKKMSRVTLPKEWINTRSWMGLEKHCLEEERESVIPDDLFLTSVLKLEWFSSFDLGYMDNTVEVSTLPNSGDVSVDSVCAARLPSCDFVFQCSGPEQMVSIYSKFKKLMPKNEIGIMCPNWMISESMMLSGISVVNHDPGRSGWTPHSTQALKEFLERNPDLRKIAITTGGIFPSFWNLGKDFNSRPKVVVENSASWYAIISRADAEKLSSGIGLIELFGQFPEKMEVLNYHEAFRKGVIRTQGDLERYTIMGFSNCGKDESKDLVRRFRHHGFPVYGRIDPDADIVFAVPVMDDHKALMELVETLKIAAGACHGESKVGIMVGINSKKKTDENAITAGAMLELQEPGATMFPMSVAWMDLENGECHNNQGTARAAMFEILATRVKKSCVLVAIDADCRVSPDFIPAAVTEKSDLFNFDLGYHGDNVKEYSYYDRWFRYNREFWKLAGSPAWWVRQKCPGICFRPRALQQVPGDVWDLANAEHLRFLDFCLAANLQLNTLEIPGAITADTRTEARIPAGMADDVIKAKNNQLIPVPHPKAAMAIRKMINAGVVKIDSYMRQTSLLGSSIPREEYVRLDIAEKALQEYKSKVASGTYK